jgi:hypothetical protein
MLKLSTNPAAETTSNDTTTDEEDARNVKERGDMP